MRSHSLWYGILSFKDICSSQIRVLSQSKVHALARSTSCFIAVSKLLSSCAGSCGSWFSYLLKGNLSASVLPLVWCASTLHALLVFATVADSQTGSNILVLRSLISKFLRSCYFILFKFFILLVELKFLVPSSVKNLLIFYCLFVSWRLIMRLRVLFACRVLVRWLMSNPSLLWAWSHLTPLISSSINRGLMSLMLTFLRTTKNWLPHWLQVAKLTENIKSCVRCVLKQSLNLRWFRKRIVILISWDASRCSA